MLRCAARVLFLALFLAPPRAVLAAEAEPAPASPEPRPDAAADPLDPWWGPLGPTALFGGGEPAARARGLSLGVSAGVARSPGERQRVFGLLELSFGLDGVGASVAGADDADPLEADAAPGATAEPDASTPALPLPAPVRVRAPPAPAGGAALASDVDPRGARLAPSAPASRPSPASPAWRSGLEAARLARAVVGEALRVHGGAAELRRLDGMAARSRTAASLPEVRLGAGTASDESLRLSPTLSDPARYTRDGGRDLWLEARLTWRLDSAIFARDEIAIMRLRAQRQEESGRLAREVLEALIEWRKACLVLDSPLALPEEQDAASVRQFGALARLDVLTDGWFSRYLERWGPSAGAGRWP